MNLKFIKTEKCPVCGCDMVVRESVRSDEYGVLKHTNGGEWETRKFLCGYGISFCPNFNKETEDTKCKYDPKELARKKKEKEDVEKLKKFCADNNISPDIIRQVSYLMPERDD